MEVSHTLSIVLKNLTSPVAPKLKWLVVKYKEPNILHNSQFLILIAAPDMFCIESKSAGVRLVNGSSQFEGSVEVCIENVWRTACGENWGQPETITACIQLGFNSEFFASDNTTVIIPQY